jgi:hypothetical protein
MTVRKIILTSTFSLFIAFVFGQTKTEQLIIQAVENGLLETKEIIFADSVIPKYNILDRMKFYKVPSVSIERKN